MNKERLNDNQGYLSEHNNDLPIIESDFVASKQESKPLSNLNLIDPLLLSNQQYKRKNGNSKAPQYHRRHCYEISENSMSTLVALDL